VLSLAVASTGVFAQLTNPIIRPTVGDTLYAGSTFDIIWNVTTPGELVSLILRKGPSNNIGIVGPIANDIDNTGEYLWSIPSNLVSGNDYAIQIIVGPASNVSNVGLADYNFTPLLTLVSNYTGNSTTSSSASPSSSILSYASSGSAASASVSASSSGGGAATATSTPTITQSTSGVAITGTSKPVSSSAGNRVQSSVMGVTGLLALSLAMMVGVVGVKW